MRAEAPAHAPSAMPGKDSPCLEYRVYLFEGGDIEMTAITSPTMNFVPTRGLQYAVSFDDAPAQTITLVPPGYSAGSFRNDWGENVANNARHSVSKHHLATPGYHTLKVWMVDPAVVLQKLVISRGNSLKPSYLGPPESLRGQK